MELLSPLLLTLNFNGGRIMAEFREEEHPRDNDGKFKEKGATDKVNELVDKYSDTPEEDKLTLGLRKPKNKPNHNYDENYEHKDGYIAGAPKCETMTFEEADNGKVNPYYDIVKGYENNCTICVATYLARRLGYNVRALPDSENNEEAVALSVDFNRAYLDEEGFSPESEFDLNEAQNKEVFLDNKIKNNDIFSLRFNSVDSSVKAGHIIIAEKDNNGNLILYDPQINKVIKKEEINNYLSDKKYFEYTNLTNCKMNEKICDKLMKGVDNNEQQSKKTT